MPGTFFYAIGLGFVGGVLLRSFFDSGIVGVLLLLAISLGAGVLWFARGRVKHSPLFIVALVALGVAGGALRFDVVDSQVSPLSADIGERVLYEGIVAREPEVRERNIHLYVEVKDVGELILVSTDRFEKVRYGDRLTVAGELTLPESFETDTGRVFNYPGYLKARGVSSVISYAHVEVVGSGEGNSVMAVLLAGKRAFVAALEGVLTEPEAGLGKGILLGVRSALGEKLEEDFRVVGIIHIIVLSGYNVMIVAEAIMRILSFVFRPYARMVIGILVITGFALVVGLSATVVRASIMAALVLIARATGRRYAVMRALMLAGVVMVLINPYLLAFDPGFQLSFIATLGLIALAPVIEVRLIKVPTKYHLREVLTATLATQIFILPFLVYQIGTFSVVSLLVNLLVLPIVPFAMLFAFVAGVAGLISEGLGIIAGFPAHALLAYIIGIAEKFAALPFASFVVPEIPFVAVVLAYALIGGGMLLLSLRRNERCIETKYQPTHQDNLYEDWVIEEEQEKPATTHSVAAGVRDQFPFR